MWGQYLRSASNLENIVYYVFETAKKHGINYDNENAMEFYYWKNYNKVLNWEAKWLNEFTFLRMIIMVKLL